MLFDSLPLLERFVQNISPVVRTKLSKTVLISVQHLLATTGSLFEGLIRLGFRPDRMFVLGKAYSSNFEVAHRLRSLGVWVNEGSLPRYPGDFQNAFHHDVDHLWERVLALLSSVGCDGVIVLDDGGHCISSTPSEILQIARVSGVEQTTSGLSRLVVPTQFRVVEVATSAAKRILEPPMISRAVLQRLPNIESCKRCGVVGVGNIGGAVISHLLQRDIEVVAFDQIPRRSSAIRGVQAVDSLAEIVGNSDLIIGCSGDDVFAAREEIDWGSGEITLISCSSEDREFRSLLTDAVLDGCLERWSPLGVTIIRRDSARLKVFRGGFPMNFDGSAESVPAREIQLTRTLLLGGILQAVLCGSESEPQGGNGRMLDPEFQATAAESWFETEPDRRGDFSNDALLGFSSAEWISEHSGGVVEDTAGMRTAFDLD